MRRASDAAAVSFYCSCILNLNSLFRLTRSDISLISASSLPFCATYCPSRTSLALFLPWGLWRKKPTTTANSLFAPSFFPLVLLPSHWFPSFVRPLPPSVPLAFLQYSASVFLPLLPVNPRPSLSSVSVKTKKQARRGRSRLSSFEARVEAKTFLSPFAIPFYPTDLASPFLPLLAPFR